MKVKFSAKEVKALIIASIILGLVFGFDDKRPTFELSFWLSNYIIYAIISLLILTIFCIAEKKSAIRYKCSSEFEIWKIKRVGFATASYSKRSVYLGILLPLFLAILSKGFLPFAAVTQSNVKAKLSNRIGREFLKLTDFELSRISIAGPFTLAILSIIIKLLSNVIPFSDKFIFVGLSIAISSMLPLPNLNGIKAYFGSRLNYVFFLSLIVLIAIMIRFISAILTFILALIVTLIIFMIFYKLREVELK